MQNQELNITEEQVQARIDVVIHEKLEIPRAHVKELIENEDILVNQKKSKLVIK